MPTMPTMPTMPPCRFVTLLLPGSVKWVDGSLLGRNLSLNQRLKVLIVDDESSQRSGLAAMVSSWGMTPETAAEGNEALTKLNEFAADVILTDLNMPGLDGFGFLERLRESGDMPPTIVLTAFGNIEIGRAHV